MANTLCFRFVFDVRVHIVILLMKITHFDYEIILNGRKTSSFFRFRVHWERQRRFIIRFKCLSSDERAVVAYTKQCTQCVLVCDVK